MRRGFRIGLGFGRGILSREVDDEIAFHLEMRARQLAASGLDPDAARREALRQFGDLEAVRRDCVTMDQERERTMHRMNFIDELRQDVIYALRTLRRDLGFSVVVVLTLALGVGANTAIFTLIEAVLLRTLPVPNASSLVSIGNPVRVGSVSSGTTRTDIFSYPFYNDLRTRTPFFTGVLASGRTPRLDVLLEPTAEQPEHPRGRFVSGNYFSVLGVTPHIGRVFGAAEDATAGASTVAVISYDYWTRRLGAASTVVGRTITINGVPFTIAGVARRGFTGEIVGSTVDVWLPIATQPLLMPNRPWLADRATNWLLLLGRLAPGATLQQAQTRVPQLADRIFDEYARSSPALTVPSRAKRGVVEVAAGAKGFSHVREEFQAPLLTLMAGVGVLLLIVCANIGNLLLARAVARAREMGVRLALGAGRSRLVRQLLTESVLLGAAGGAAGLLVAWWGSRLLLALAADGGTTLPLALRLNLPVLAFTGAVALCAVLLFGLAPALRASRVDLATTMRASARSVSGGLGARGQRFPLGRLLIASQVALSLVLLLGAGLLVRSLQSLQEIDPGLDRDHLLIADVDPVSRGYVDARIGAFAQETAVRLKRIPGIAAVSYSENGIFSGTESESTVQIPGFIAHADDDTLIYYDQVGPDYARAIGARLLQGRDIDARDDAGAPRVALVNETLARFYFPDGNVIGRTLRFDSTTSAQIVGVIGDTKDHDLRGAPVRRAYVPYLHPNGAPGSLRFEVRTPGDPALVTTAVRRALADVDGSVPVLGINPLTSLMRQSLRQERLVARLAAGFGALALLLAAVGLYGVMSYAIARRTGEIGVRVALGARPGEVVRMVLGDSLRLVTLGLAIGLPLALAAVRLLGNQLHGVGTADPLSVGLSLLVLVASGVAAGLLPALRASRVAPVEALRQE